jgi:4'-phosphopantetheinyl transferase
MYRNWNKSNELPADMDNSVMVLYTRITHELDKGKFSGYLHRIPEKTRQRIERFRRWQDAQASLFGQLLLKEGLALRGEYAADLNDIQLSSYNRPGLPGGPDFNISHSGSLVVCAFVSNGRVGIDVEEMKPVDIEDFRFLFTETEWSDICRAPSCLHRFYYYWTRKEAVVKAEGSGLNAELKKIYISEQYAAMDGQRWHLYPMDLGNDYEACFAAEKEPGSVEVREIHF